MIKNFQCFAQFFGDTWNDVAWKQETKVEYKTVDAKDGKTETEDTKEIHVWNVSGNWYTQVADRCVTEEIGRARRAFEVFLVGG